MVPWAAANDACGPFLREVTRTRPSRTQAAVVSSLGVNAVPRAIAMSFGAPHGMVLNRHAVDPVLFQEMLDALPDQVTNHGHPLRGARAFDFNQFLAPVLTTINRGNAANRAVVQHALHVRVRETGRLRINVSGRVDNYVSLNGEPWCVLVAKKHSGQSDSEFKTGCNQALVYAAAIARLRAPAHAVLAIVTDLARWQLFRVTSTDISESTMTHVAYNADGIPDEGDLGLALNQTFTLLYQNM